MRKFYAKVKKEIDFTCGFKLVELDYNRMKGGLQFIQMQLELQALLNRKVDLVSTQGLAASLAPQINSDKMEVYVWVIQ